MLGISTSKRISQSKWQRRTLNEFLRLALVALILPSGLFAQEENGASLIIRFADGASRFHVGEIIPIELSFRASIPEMYDMSTANYDRSGRLNIEQFHVDPPGRDPLKRYYSIGGFMGGGVSSSVALSSEPQTMREDLNEWAAFDQPGHYSLSVTSGRISRRSTEKFEPVELQSNTLELDIVPADPAWQHQTLSSALTTLHMASTTDEEKAAALRVLRFLDSPASLHELVVLLGSSPEGSNWNAMGGLAGSRHQARAVRELEQQMAVPDIAITGSYLHLLARLKLQLNHEPLPPYPETDPEQQKLWMKRMEAQEEELRQVLNGLYDKTGTLISAKRGAAKAETIQTLLFRSSSGLGNLKPAAEPSPEEVAANFLNLPQEQQWNLLESLWDRLKSPSMSGPLKHIVQLPDMSNQTLRDAALRCLYDLDTREATPIFLEEIKHPHIDNGMPAVKGETLALLPNETLPQFDQMLADRIAAQENRTAGLDAQLIGRFSTKAILPRVKAFYETAAGRWDCVIEDGLVSYFLRVDPAYGVKELARSPSVCMTTALPAVIKMGRWRDVEPEFIAALNGANLSRAREAAETLAKYGSSQAEDALWERLRKFSEQSAARETQEVRTPGIPRQVSESASFQFALVDAIGRAQAWLVTNEQIDELENLTHGYGHENVKEWHWKAPVSVIVSFSGFRTIATVNQYSTLDLASLNAKLAQYPRGTRFTLNIVNASREAQVRAAITETAAEHGLDVTQAEEAN